MMKNLLSVIRKLIVVAMVVFSVPVYSLFKCASLTLNIDGPTYSGAPMLWLAAVQVNTFDPSGWQTPLGGKITGNLGNLTAVGLQLPINKHCAGNLLINIQYLNASSAIQIRCPLPSIDPVGNIFGSCKNMQGSGEFTFTQTYEQHNTTTTIQLKRATPNALRF